MERHTREASDLIVICNQAHGNSFDEQVELHLFYRVALHVWLHGRSHDVMRWIHHHEAGQMVCALRIYPQKISSFIFAVTLPPEFHIPASFFKSECLREFYEILSSLALQIKIERLWS